MCFQSKRIQMDSVFYIHIDKIASLALIPYLASMLITIPYFVYRKILIVRQLRSIPASTIFPTDLSNVKKNLQIKSLIHSFILIVYSFEAISCLLLSVSSVYRAFINNPNNYSLKVKYANRSCTIQVDTQLELYLTISEYIVTPLPIFLNLFFIVLRRVYLNCPYKRWIIGFSVYFIFRLVCIVLVAYYTHHIQILIELPFLIFDFCVYVNSSKKFYLLLKGMSIEAKLHFSPQEYRNRHKTTKIFAITRMVLLLTFLLAIAMSVIGSMPVAKKLIENSDYLLKYILPNTPINLTVPSSLSHFLNKAAYSIMILQKVCMLIFSGIAFFSNLAILIWVISRLIIRRQVYVHVNECITRPLMERYRADVERNNIRRPPFIQAFRSQLIY